MASGDVFFHAQPRDLVPENGLPHDPNKYLPAGGLIGLPLKKLDADGYQFLLKIPANGTPLSTGVTVELITVDEPNNPDVSKVFRLGVTVKKIASGTDNLTQTGAGTEATVDITSNATSGVVTSSTVAITTANADTPVAGGLALVRVRRLSSNAADVHKGVPLLLGVVVRDT